MGVGDSLLAELQSGEPFPVADAVCSSSTSKSRAPHKIIRSRLEKLRFAGGGGAVSSSKSYDAVAGNGVDSKGLSLGKKISKTLAHGFRRGGGAQASGSLGSTPTGSQYSLHGGVFAQSLDGGMLRVYEVEGASGHKNAVIVSPCRAATAERNVVFFPGDVQDFADIMSRDARLRTWSGYSYEFVMDRLEAHYPDANIILVIPSRKHLGAYSCYDNFLDTDQLGSPAARTAEHKAYPQLMGLLYSIQRKNATSTSSSSPSPVLSSGANVSAESQNLQDSSSPAAAAVLTDGDNRQPPPPPGPVCAALAGSGSGHTPLAGRSPCASDCASPSPLTSSLVSRGRAASSGGSVGGTGGARALVSKARTFPARGGGDDAATPRAAAAVARAASLDGPPPPLDAFDAALPLTLVAFSKGCTVLNQLAAEMHADASGGGGARSASKHSALRRLRSSKSRKLRAQLSMRESSADDESDVGSRTGSFGGTKSCESNASASSLCTGGGGGDAYCGLGDLGGSGRVLTSQAVTSILHSKLSRHKPEDCGGAPGEDAAAAVAAEEPWPRWPWDKTVSFVYLDAGHSGSEGAWIVDEETVKTLKSTLTSLEVHTSPYQVNNERELWKKQEYGMFRHYLHASSRNRKAQVTIFDHSTQDEPSIRVHFRVLDVF